MYSTLSLDLCTFRDTTLTQNVNVRCYGSPAPKLRGKGDTENCSFVFWGAVMAAKKAFDVGDIIVYARGENWLCSFQTPGGRQRRSLHTANRRAAERKARQIDELVSRQAWEKLEDLDEERKKPTMFQAFICQDFLTKYCDWSATTRQGNASRLKMLCVECTARDIKTYLKRRGADGLSDASQNRYLAALKAIFKAAVAYGHCTSNPAADVKMLRGAKQVPKALTDGQVESLLRECNDQIRPVVIVAIDTGLRRSELFNLTWGDVDVEEDGKLTIGKSKTGEFRVVWLTDRAKSVLTDLKSRQLSKKVVDVRVFPFTDIRGSLDAAAERAGIGHVHMHQFRHTYATRLRDKGVPLDRIKELLGTRRWRWCYAMPKHGLNRLAKR